jgi:cytochrome subunit of sulfide dehydrogenase
MRIIFPFLYKTLFASSLLIGFIPAQAQEAEKLHQRANAAMCANCHGSEGRTVDTSAVPPLAGLPKDYLVQQMQAFKDGSRNATVMHQISKGLSDAQITSLADYFATQTR